MEVRIGMMAKMSVWNGFVRRWAAGLRLAAALSVGGAAVSACGSSSEPAFAVFSPEDCQGQLVEVARFSSTWPMISATGPSRSLAIDGDTLYLAYEFGGPSPAGGIVAVPTSGGDPHLVAAAENTSQWTVGEFWVSEGQIYLQNGDTIASVPADSSTPSVLPHSHAEGYADYAHDSEFAYAAQSDDGVGFALEKIPLGGGAPIALGPQPLAGVSVNAMADAGDALLVLVQWLNSSTGAPYTRVWRVPKDGTTRSDVRTDVGWAYRSYPLWLAWDGQDVLGPIVVQNAILQARVSPTGTSSPTQLKLLGGGAITRRDDEILSLQAVGSPTTGRSQVLVASSKGAEAGSVVACGTSTPTPPTPAGIAANEGGIYVAYELDGDTVIARVAP